MKYLFVFLPIFCFGQVTTYQSQVQGWNYLATMPIGYNSQETYPTLIFFPGLGEIGTNVNKLKYNGPHAYITNSFTPLPNFIVISLQPITAYPSAQDMNIRINDLKMLYNIDGSRLNFTGLSHGGWCSVTMVQNSNSLARSIITVEGVQPGDQNFYPDTLALKYFTGTYICFEQQNDYRLGDVIVNYLGSPSMYIVTNFGGGGHCCWNSFYGPNPQSFQEIGGTIYQWLYSINLNTVSLTANKTVVRINKYLYKATVYTGYNVYNIYGQTMCTGYFKPGYNTLFLKPGYYIIRTYFGQVMLVWQTY